MRIFLIIISLITIVAESAHAACSTGYSSVLDPTIDAITYTYSDEGIWDVTAPYGHLLGIEVCNDTSGSRAVASATDFPTGTTGQHCWCKMLSPARSAWVYLYDIFSAADCATFCATLCGNDVGRDAQFRSAMFASVTEDICTPNTISINWKDATGSTASSTTCTYDDALVTPSAAPTKRGYRFTGWSYQ